jgi:phospholipase/carboxylesterase
MNDDNIQAATIMGIKLKYYIPVGEGQFPVILMLHGWTGDENSMWVFSSKMPAGALLISPRGLFESASGGYGWYRDSLGGLPALEDFSEGIDQIATVLRSNLFALGDFSRFMILGFSQGAALAYSLALLRVFNLQALAGLSGFVPDGADKLIAENPLSGLPVFVAHGTKDQIVPVGRARHGLDLLKQAGANVTYCEDEVGHKLSASCFSALREFLSRQT